MGKINNYTVSSTPNPGDKILCSDANTGDTKNITPQGIIDLERSSKIYRAYIKQTSTTAPDATLIAGNTIEGTWSYAGVGEYLFTSTGEFDGVKASCFISIPNAQDTTFEFAINNNDSIYIRSFSAGVASDGLINDFYIEIMTHDI